MKLIIEDDEGRKTVVPVVRDEITIGRNEQNLIRLPEKNVSRRHGRLLREAGQYYIEDLNSFTGIRVNGEKIAGRRKVDDGDLIQISEYDLILQAAPGEQAAPPGVMQVAPHLPAAPRAAPEPEVVAPKEPAANAEAEAAAQAEADARARRLAETATIRLSDLRGADGEVPPQDVPEEQRPKLVGISGKYRGEELILDRSPIRLGRSEENDLQIEHPSISRRHLRLHLENGSWKVMDAESRNGVRVNGEPYAQIALRHGDILEVGHLRFAFVERGRAFQLPPEHAPVAGTMIPEPVVRSRTALFVGAGIAAVAFLAAAVFLFLRSRAEADLARRLQVERGAALRSAGESVAAHRYAEALVAVEAARRAGASSADLSPWDDLEREARGEDAYREMEAAAAAQDWERARKLLGALAGTQTFYGAKAAERAGAITAGYVDLHLKAAAQMRGKDDAGCLTEAQLALSADPQNAQARALADACNAPAVRTASVGPGQRPARPTPSRRTVRSGNDPEARRLLEEGNKKLLGQDLSGAVAAYQRALTLHPSRPVLAGLYRSMGIAFTRQGNIEEGAHYYRLYLPLCENAAERAQLQKVLDDYDARRR